MRTQEVYGSVDGVDLVVDLWGADVERPGRPAMLWFHGGGWRHGSPEQFRRFAEALAARGWVAGSAAYRLTSGASRPPDCVDDARTAVRWMQEAAPALGVDPARLAVGGGSAGGHLAACCAVLGVEGASHPVAAAVLLNPVVSLLRPDEGGPPGGWSEALGELVGDFGERRRELSPLEHVRSGLPPALVHHGVDDVVVPVAQARALRDAMVAAGDRCELIEHEGAGHGFFNAGQHAFASVLDSVLTFLADVVPTWSGSRAGQ